MLKIFHKFFFENLNIPIPAFLTAKKFGLLNILPFPYRKDFYPLYFLKNVVPTCDSLTYVNWNQTRKLLEESVVYPTKQKNGKSNRDGLFRRKKLNVSTMPV